ncbi:MAG: DUF86 domain-containing protein [Candidatus Thorarchaeota archaeon]|nr:DUF86 domain-containing protein [Candidatus Thorarchaeota archaeon]
MAIDSVVVRRRISHILSKLEYLRQQLPITLEKLEDLTLLQSIERCLEVIGQAIIDISASILAELHEPIPKSYRETVIALGTRNIIGSDLAQRLANLASMRNILVHEYLEVDLDIIVRTVPLVLDDAHEFITAVNRLLKKSE